MKRIFIDRWIDRLDSGYKPALSREQEVVRIAASLSMMAPPGRKVLFCGGAEPEKISELAGEMTGYQKNKGEEGAFLIESGADLLTDGRTVELLESAAGVVLVEQRNYSNGIQIEQSVELLKKLNKPVLGMVLL